MSKHSTECLIDKLKYWKGVVAIDDDYIDEVIARLRAADALCKAAERARKDFDRVNELAKLAGVHPFTLTPKDLDKAIAEYDGKEE